MVSRIKEKHSIQVWGHSNCIRSSEKSPPPPPPPHTHFLFLCPIHRGGTPGSPDEAPRGQVRTTSPGPPDRAAGDTSGTNPVSWTQRIPRMESLGVQPHHFTDRETKAHRRGRCVQCHKAGTAGMRPPLRLEFFLLHSGS